MHLTDKHYNKAIFWIGLYDYTCSKGLKTVLGYWAVIYYFSETNKLCYWAVIYYLSEN